ncbi:hypothetical protein WICPIJ_007347 [Wickerhamomyces pijperi]|nr:hypothetical protein WICPIJ_007347 [Wickerhamomyces pijperi]
MLAVDPRDRIGLPEAVQSPFLAEVDWCHDNIKGKHSHYLVTEEDLQRADAELKKQAEPPAKAPVNKAV